MIVLSIFLLGFGIRMLDLTDLPLDFNPTRQLLSAIKARGMYYQFAGDVPNGSGKSLLQQWKDTATYEPPLNETITAGMYLLFGEHLWIARVLS